MVLEKHLENQWRWRLTHKLSMEKLMPFPTPSLTLPLPFFILLAHYAPDFSQELLPCECLEQGVIFRMKNKHCKTLCALRLKTFCSGAASNAGTTAPARQVKKLLLLG